MTMPRLAATSGLLLVAIVTGLTSPTLRAEPRDRTVEPGPAGAPQQAAADPQPAAQSNPAPGAQTATQSPPASPPTADLGSDAATPPPAAPPAQQPADAAAAPPPPPAAHPVIAAVRAQLAATKERGTSDARAALTAFYGARGEGPLWVADQGGYSPKGEAVIAELKKADDWGLKASTFEVDPPPPPGSTPEVLAHAELSVSKAALLYARQAKGGRVDPQSISSNIGYDPVYPDPAKVIADLAASEAPATYLLGMHPKHPEFEALHQALLAARNPSAKVDEDDKAPVEVPPGPAFKPGAKDAGIALLRQRLGVTAEAGQEDVYDDTLAGAVRAFQRERGLKANGVLTDATRKALNAPKKAPVPGRNILKIIANMERWRWMPDDLGSFYVADNIPEFMMSVVKNGEVVYRDKIIVGTPENATPVFTANMLYVVFHPDWNVPDGIKVKEILPYLRSEGFNFFGFGGSDTRILQVHNLRVSYNGRPVDAAYVDWNNVDIRRYTFTQPPGPTNVLGVLKFRFPNKYDVYMHDTIQREFFSHEQRSFSHGCMRVENPRKLAEVILAEDQGLTSADVGRLLAGGSSEITLKTPFPVHVNYFTAVVRDGKVRYFNDLYGHDSRLIAALEGRSGIFNDEIGSSQVITLGQGAGESGGQRSRRAKQDPFESFISGLMGN